MGADEYLNDVGGVPPEAHACVWTWNHPCRLRATSMTRGREAQVYVQRNPAALLTDSPCCSSHQRMRGEMMRRIAIALAVALTSVPASAQLRSIPATTTIHAVVLPAGSCISSPFGPRILPDHPQAGTFHNGVDLPAPEGTSVRAVAPGKLLRIENGGPGGLEVLIQNVGYVSVYSHLASVAPSLGKGPIAAGDDIGVVGHTGVSFGPHLFFALLENGRAVDPRSFLDLPMCNGTTTHQRTRAEILAAGEKPPPRGEALKVARNQEALLWQLRAALGRARQCIKQRCSGEASQLPPARHYYHLSDFPAAHHNVRNVKRVSEAGSH